MESNEINKEKLSEVLDLVIKKLNKHSEILKSFDDTFIKFSEAFEDFEARISKLENKQSITNQLLTKKNENVSTDRVYQTPTNGIEIPGAKDYLIFENQAIKAPSGYFVKPFIDGNYKLVTIEGKQYDVRRLHAKLHLIPGILNNPKMSESEKQSKINSICNKYNFDLTPALLGFNK